MAGIPVIIDTDFSSDVGDATALAQAAAMHNAGIIEILAVVVSTSNTKAPAAVDALLTYYGLDTNQTTGVKIGCWKGAAFDPDPHPEWTDIMYTYPHPNTGLASTVADGLDVFREVLAARTTNDVHFIALGPLNAVAELLNSTADGYSALSGSALVTASVAKLYLMGGKFNYTPAHVALTSGITFLHETGTYPKGVEWNILQDYTAAADVATNWPTDVYWFPFEEGNSFVSGDTIASVYANDTLMYDTMEAAGYLAGREAWDNLPLLALQYRDWFLYFTGTLTLNAGANGETKLTSGTGSKHYVARKKRSDALMKSTINHHVESAA